MSLTVVEPTVKQTETGVRLSAAGLEAELPGATVRNDGNEIHVSLR